MDVEKFVKEQKGEILANKARVRHGGKVVIVGRLQENEWVPTDEGMRLSYELNVKESEAKAAKQPARKAAPKTRKKQD
jgi:single-stranded DNA-binding protein